MSISALRNLVLATAMLTIVLSSLNVGWVYGILAVTVPLLWSCFFCLRHGRTTNRFLPGSFLWPVALCFATACMIAPAIVALAELFNNAFAAISAQSPLAYFVLRAGLVEELLKLSAVLIVLRYLAKGAITHPKDGVILACAAALGFSAYENLYHNLYLVQLESGIAQAFFLGALVRVPLHPLYSSMWGAALGIAYFTSGAKRYLTLVLGLIPAVFLHGLWDTLAQSQGTVTGVLLTLLYAAIWYCYWRTWKGCEAFQLVTSGSNQNSF